MRLLNSLVLGFYLLSRELLLSRSDVLASPGILKRSPPPSPTAGHHLTPAQEALVKDAQKKGVKMDAASLMNIWKISHIIEGVATDILFLEEGNEKAGMKHIWGRHSKEFTQKGISEGEIPHLMEQATTGGSPVAFQGKNKGRPIFKTSHNGQALFVAISIGSNGFVVGANPCSKPEACAAD
ncbi:hypothetical protein BDZ97DRAFT_1830250 [Flammula alnicola]|nr:hypothetical protein BDZ97DRAFT_1830250 [Flammula alnicola]